MNEIVYPVHGGMEDWGYAASWDTSHVTPCAPKANGGYAAEKTHYGRDAIRAVEIVAGRARTVREARPDRPRLGRIGHHPGRDVGPKDAAGVDAGGGGGRLRRRWPRRWARPTQHVPRLPRAPRPPRAAHPGLELAPTPDWSLAGASPSPRSTCSSRTSSWPRPCLPGPARVASAWSGRSGAPSRWTTQSPSGARRRQARGRRCLSWPRRPAAASSRAPSVLLTSRLPTGACWAATASGPPATRLSRRRPSPAARARLPTSAPLSWPCQCAPTRAGPPRRAASLRPSCRRRRTLRAPARSTRPSTEASRWSGEAGGCLRRSR